MADEILEEVTETPTEENPVQADPTPTPPTIADKVKLALRISHTLLDAEISDVITSARLELKRVGVSIEKAEGNEENVETAIKTYALAYYASDVKDAERYQESFKYQCDCLRKSYPQETDNV